MEQKFKKIIWRNGEQVTIAKCLAELDNDITKAKREIKNLEQFKNVLQKALTAYADKQFANLKKAEEKYGGIEGIHDAYGWGMINESVYTRYKELYEEREDSSYMHRFKQILETADRDINMQKRILDRLTTDRENLMEEASE